MAKTKKIIVALVFYYHTTANGIFESLCIHSLQYSPVVHILNNSWICRKAVTAASKIIALVYSCADRYGKNGFLWI